MKYSGYVVSFWGDRHAWGHRSTMNVLNATLLFIHFKMLPFMLCKFCLNKIKIRKFKLTH